MALVLERAHALERDAATDVDVRRGDVDPELHAERTTERELRLEGTGREDVDGVSRELRDAHRRYAGFTWAAVTSAGERQPRSASAFSVSSRRISSTCSTPFDPPNASPYIAGRPTSTARAPSASAIDDVGAAPYAAVEIDLGAVADGFDDLGKRLERRDRAVELTPAVVRDDDARGAVLAREVAHPRP